MPTIDELYNKLVQSQEYIDGDLSLSCTETADYIWNDLMLKYDGYNDEILKGCLDSSN